MKGKLMNCVTGEVTEIELGYYVEPACTNDKRVFKLIGGVTGYEGVYLKDEYIQKIIKNGWYANIMLKNKYDGLHIAAEEMKKVFIESGCIKGDECEKTCDTNR
jgi:hypothetical protein